MNVKQSSSIIKKKGRGGEKTKEGVPKIGQNKLDICQQEEETAQNKVKLMPTSALRPTKFIKPLGGDNDYLSYSRSVKKNITGIEIDDMSEESSEDPFAKKGMIVKKKKEKLDPISEDNQEFSRDNSQGFDSLGGRPAPGTGIQIINHPGGGFTAVNLQAENREASLSARSNSQGAARAENEPETSLQRQPSGQSSTAPEEVPAANSQYTSQTRLYIQYVTSWAIELAVCDLLICWVRVAKYVDGFEKALIGLAGGFLVDAIVKIVSLKQQASVRPRNKIIKTAIGMLGVGLFRALVLGGFSVFFE